MELKVEFDVDSWSGTAPFFPLPAYRHFVQETVANGTRMLRARAANKLGIEGKEWIYSVINNDEVS